MVVCAEQSSNPGSDIFYRHVNRAIDPDTDFKDGPWNELHLGKTAPVHEYHDMTEPARVVGTN
jgi:hypothetical protein